MSKIYIVIAGNAWQAKNWIRENHIAPKDARIVTRIEQLYGLRDCVVVRCGTWHENPVALHENFDWLIRDAELRVKLSNGSGETAEQPEH